MSLWLTKAFSFFFKEVNGIRRQPRLLLSLIGGPALVLALFGASFRGPTPVLRTVLVWPENGIPGVDRKLVEDVIEENFELVKTVSDPDEALLMLSQDQVDVVQMIPVDILERAGKEKQPKLEIYSQTINPNIEIWLQSLTYVETTYINQQILLERTRQSQNQALSIQKDLTGVQAVLSGLDAGIDPERQQQAYEAVYTLKYLLSFLLAYLPLPSETDEARFPQVEELRVEVQSLLSDLNQLEGALDSDTIETQIERLRQISSQLDNLQGTIDTFAGAQPEDIIFPVQSNYTNLRGETYSMVIFYVPGVLALLIQHLGIALGALAIVREQLLGAFEMFRIAPVSVFQIILGKTVAFTLYIFLVVVVLVLLLHAMNVPFLGSMGLVLALVLLLALASIGIGLLISSISDSDNQAIQLTMILLLFSIFFTGFFMPLSSFSSLAQPVSALLPMTHGLFGLQSLMLLGHPPAAAVWIGLALIALVSFALALLRIRSIFHSRLG